MDDERHHRSSAIAGDDPTCGFEQLASDKADLTNARLFQANLSSATLSDAKLTQTQLDDACDDASTKPPEGLGACTFGAPERIGRCVIYVTLTAAVNDVELTDTWLGEIHSGQ
jgi:hypothetical protein